MTDGAFSGGNEHTRWGVLVGPIAIEPADAYLLVHQDKIPVLHARTGLYLYYLYALANPATFCDPSGRLAFLAVLIVAAAAGATIGAIGATVNGVGARDEFLLWVVGGAVGGMLAVVAWAGVICGVAALIGGAVAFIAAATAGLVIFSVAGLLGAVLTPALDGLDSPVAWFFGFLAKWAQSPLTTTVGLVAAVVVGIAGGRVDFRRGMLFIEVGSGGGALTLGAVAWTQSGGFNPDGTVPDDLARHEAQHGRTAAAIGELGFYFTYLTVGAAWGAAQGGSWNDLNGSGCGNPFEKQAHTFTDDPGTATSASSCSPRPGRRDDHRHLGVGHHGRAGDGADPPGDPRRPRWKILPRRGQQEHGAHGP